MKNTYILLTTTMLLSLQTALQCSENNDVITAPRQNSGIHHDGTRDGFFGSGLDTLENIALGKSYGSQPYGIGSDEKAQERWEAVGKTIKKLKHAETYLTEVNKKGWTLSPEALAPSKKLIQDYYSQPKLKAQALITSATARLNDQIQYEQKLAEELRELQKQATVNQEKCLSLLPLDPINNSFATQKQLDNNNIRSFIAVNLKNQQSASNNSDK